MLSPSCPLGSRSGLVLASRNPGKIRDFSRLLGDGGWDLRSLDDVGFEGDLDEPGDTYAENALAKATVVTRRTGLAALADDSGIEVVALDGWPGPRSARWMGPTATGPERLRGLIEEIDRRCQADRRVRYVCALALARPDGPPVIVHGSCDGALIDPVGINGFGYDPGFFSDELGCTFGEAEAELKDRVSHRGRAVARLVASCGLRPPQ